MGRKYFYVNGTFPNNSIWAGFFSPSSFPLRYHSEDERFYEFFTDKEMSQYVEPYVIKAGIRAGDSGHYLYMMFEDTSLGRIFIGAGWRLISATEFAEKVRSLMKRKEQIVASIEAYLAKSSANERLKQEQEKLQQAKKAEEKANAESWLDSVMKNNK